MNSNVNDDVKNGEEKHEETLEEGGGSTVSDIRRQLKQYYDEVNMRASTLEESRPAWSAWVYTLSPFSWGYNVAYRYEGDEMTPPAGLRDELKHIRKELKMWSTVNKGDLEEDVEDLPENE